MLRVVLFAALSLLLTLLLAYSAFDTPSRISPQGCRMSYMSPSYVLQTDFNSSWTSPTLASRYRLMLYREVGWDQQDNLRGVPVLFIPGNAGSAHQVRSIASSASRQYYLSPSLVNPVFTSRNLKPLDVFAVDFNEDLSAFHGPTLSSQRRYSADAISYTLSLYPPGTQIIVLGHSMGGLVATALLPSPQIAAIITMSTPHGVPPARFDSRVDVIYSNVQRRLASDPTPILSLCGGITDTMIPSEFCVLPPVDNEDAGYRKTVFTSSLEDCWTGVGHREMVWCHQVRWRVARAVLELGGATAASHVFDHWFRDGLDLSGSYREGPESELGQGPIVSVKYLPLVITSPQNVRYELTIPHDEYGEGVSKVVIFLSQGSIYSVSPADPLPLKASIHVCRETRSFPPESAEPACEPIQPSTLKLIPNLDPYKQFPLPQEGVDEADGVVVLTAELQRHRERSAPEWIYLEIESDTSKGWGIATIEAARCLIRRASGLVPMFGVVKLDLDPSSLHIDVQFRRFLSDVLLVYRAEAKLTNSCKGVLLPPLLLHTSGPHEGHYHRLSNGVPILLHSHSSAPFLPVPKHLRRIYSRGLNFTIYSSGECGVESLTIAVDWWNSFGRWGTRYWNAILAWSMGVICFMLFSSWSAWDRGAPMASPLQSLISLSRLLPQAMVVFTLVSAFPLPSAFWLGNVGELMFAFLAPLLLFLSFGLVTLSWIILLVALIPYGKVASLISRNSEEDTKEHPTSIRAAILSVSLMSVLVFLFIPWQVAFLACYLIHLHNCALLLQTAANDRGSLNARNQKLLMLLAMTWCLPIVAPVLVVWVRTLATAGLTTSFDGDHLVLNSLSFVALTYAMATMPGSPFQRRHRREVISVPYFYAIGAGVAFLVGPRLTYRLYEALNWPTLALFCFRVAPRYIHGVRSAAPANVVELREIRSH